MEKQAELIAAAKGEKKIGVAASEATLDSFLQPSVAELFFCERVILVEGMEDQALIDTFLELKGLRDRFLKSGGHIVPVGGKGSLVSAIALAIGFELPFLCVFDADTTCKASDVEMNKRQNREILRLCDRLQEPTDSEVWPTAEYYSKKAIIWPRNIQETLISDCPEWEAECIRTATEFGWSYDRLRKNPSLMEATLTRMVRAGSTFRRLEAATANILSFFESN